MGAATKQKTMGLPPLTVIMSVIVGGFAYALFTSSHHVVFGPSNAMSIILAPASPRI